ncbi:MAG: sulfotransferase family protein [Streptosporangiaceae bacterium]
MARSVAPPMRRAAHAVSVLAGRLTAPARTLPGFLIVGAQRCGTTSMYRTLSQHPAILKAVLHKGVHYFDMNYDRGPNWYRAHFPLTVSGRRVRGGAALTFESSPYYMFHPLAADRIAADLPEVRLLVLVRDPVERAYSAHAHELARKFETETFERALELEEQRLRGEVDKIGANPRYLSHCHQHNAYLARGRYAEQLARLERLFGADRIHVVDSGDFFTKPEPVYDGVLDFLGLPRRGYPEFERHNARPRSPMPATLRSRLEEYFQPYDEQLTRWLREVPSWRR